MKFLVGSLFTAAACAMEANDVAFLQFAAKHGKSYESLADYKMRSEQF
jgi:hypothetical protein